MSKVIRTARFVGPAVTVGQAARDLYVGGNEEKEKSVEAMGIGALIEKSSAKIKTALDAEWEGKMQQEVSYVRGEGDKRFQEAQTSWDAEREALHAERYEEGVQSGIAQCEGEVKEAVGRLESLHQSLIDERTQILVESEVAVVDLAVALARRIIGIQVVANPKAFLQVVRSALAHMTEQSNLEIKVHPDDLAIAQRYVERWVAKVDADAVLKVRTSAHVARGGCMVEGREENVDARLEEQLKIMRAALRAAILDEERDEDTQMEKEVEDAGRE